MKHYKQFRWRIACQREASTLVVVVAVGAAGGGGGIAVAIDCSG